MIEDVFIEGDFFKLDPTITKKVLLNLKHIIAIMPHQNSDYSIIHMTIGQFNVLGKYDDVKRGIEAAIR